MVARMQRKETHADGRKRRTRPRRACVLLLVLAAVGCNGDDGAGVQPRGEPRTYAVGWAPIAPRADVALVVALMDSIARVSDITIMQQPVPWPELFAGASFDSLVEDRGNVADYLRARGMDIIFLVDPLYGLDRTQEDPGLVAAGRSILEPEIRATHEEWVRRIAARIRPAYFGLASEINTLAAHGDPALYTEIRDLVNTLAPQIRTASPGTKVFVSFQVDEANGAIHAEPIDHFDLIDDYDIDALGLSSYPVFFFDSPADIPADYFARFDAATDLPLLMVEGGWSSQSVPWSPRPSSHQQQIEFLRRYERMLDGVRAEAWVMLTFTDLDVNALGLPPDQAQGLANFAYMGILDVNLKRKPAYAEWQRIHARPRAR